MYKSRLQELCQRKAWDSPTYTVSKDGPDHDPRFQASVTVNDVAYHSGSLCKSTREAQNHAAQVAFPQLSSSAGSLNTTSNLTSNAPARGTSPVETNKASQAPQLKGMAPVVKDDNRFTGSLDTTSSVASYAPVRGTSPVETEEASQAPQLRGAATVVNDDNRFTDIQHLYKNQLLIFAQKRNLSLPIYSCEREGPPHASRFRCKVIIDEQTFQSLEFSPTVREAEHAAAKLALMSLSPDEVQEENSVYKNLLQELAQKQGYPLPFYATKTSGEAHLPTFVSTVEIQDEVFTGQEARTKKQAELSAAKVAFTILKEGHTHKPEFCGHDVRRLSDLISSSHLSSDCASNLATSSGIPALVQASQLPVENNTSTSSCTRVVVRPRVPNMTFPAGSTVMLMSDDKWVAVELNTQSNK